MKSTKHSNNNSVYLGSVAFDEINTLNWMLFCVRRYYKSGFDPLVYCDGSFRRWQVANEEIVVNVEGGSADFEGTYLLSTEFMLNLIPLSEFGRGAFNLATDGRNITASSTAGTLSMKGGVVNSELRVIRQRRLVEARLSRDHLVRLVETCTRMPTDHTEFALKSEKKPMTSVTIGHDEITCKSDRNSHGLQKVTASSLAITSGTGFVSLPSLLLYQMVRAFSYRVKSAITISLDPEGGDYVEFSAERMYIAIRIGASR